MISLADQTAIEGVVVDEQHQPVANATVDNLKAASRVVKSDADGKFRLQYGQWGLIARHGDGRQGIYQRAGAARGAAIQVMLKKPRALTVSVVDKDAKPVAEAQVALLARPLARIAAGVTDAKGVWRVQYPADAHIEEVVALKSGEGLEHYSTLVAENSSQLKPLPDDILIKLAGARTVRVTTVDSAGSPLPNISVHPWIVSTVGQVGRVNMSGWSLAHRETDASGVVVFDWLPQNAKGAIPLMANATGYRSTQRFSVPAGAGAIDVKMTLVRISTITGRVVFPDGSPAANIRLVARGAGAAYGGQATTITNAEGSYRLAAEGDQIFIVGVEDDHWAAPSHVGIVVREGQDVENIDFRLSEGAVVRGTVTYGADRRPAQGVLIGLLFDGGNLPEVLPNVSGRDFKMQFARWAATGADGTYRICANPGTFELRGPLQLRAVKLTLTDQDEVVHDIHLPRMITGARDEVVEGQIVGADNRPFDGALLHGMPRSPVLQFSWRPGGQSEHTFRFAISILPAVFEVHSAEGQLAGIARIETDDQPRIIRLAPAASARGTLRDEKEQPARGIRLRYGIEVSENAASRASASSLLVASFIESGAEGQFQLTGLVPGEEYALEYETEPQSDHWRRLTTVKAIRPEAVHLGDVRLPTSE